MRASRFTAITSAIVTAVILGAAAPSHAASVIAVGGDPTPRQVPFTATTTGLNFDTDYGLPSVCGPSTVSGAINAGASAPGASIASIDSSTWTDCSWPTIFSTEFNVTQTSSWDLNASTNAPGGVVQLSVTGIVDWTWSSVEAGFCDFNVSGTVRGSFDSNTQRITIDDPNSEYPLEITDVDGCFGEVLDGDGMHVVGDFDVTTAEGPITFQ